MLKKFLATASVVGLLAGAAHAVEIDNYMSASDGGDFDEVYPLAEEMDYDGGAVDGTLSFGFGPSAGSFPTGNVLLFISATGVEFDGALDGTEVGGTTTSVISNGGQSGASAVTFLISGADLCADVAIPGDSTCSVDIPVILTGSDVSVSVGLETDAGADVDNTNSDTRVSRTLIELLPAFAIDIEADLTATTADLLAVGGPFTDFTGPSDNTLGTYEVAPNDGDYGPVNTDLANTDVGPGDVDAVDLLLAGTMDAFEAGDVTFDGTSADDIDATADEATYDATGDFDAGALDVQVDPDLATAIARSDYDLTVTVTPDALSNLVSGTTKTDALQSIDRNGTQVTFPWTQTETQGAASGASSVFRIGNLDNTDTGAVFVEVKNASEAGFVNPGITQLAPSIDANGEFVVNSAGIEAAVGNYGRGDVEFTVEAEPDTLTGRQFVVRNGVVQQVLGGNVDQDVNN
jgi:hypothetical protein